MKLINYDKYKKWSPRQAVLLAVMSAFSAGLYLGTAASRPATSHEFWWWFRELTMGFSMAVLALLSAMVALHHIGPSTKADNAPVPDPQGR